MEIIFEETSSQFYIPNVIVSLMRKEIMNAIITVENCHSTQGSVKPENLKRMDGHLKEALVTNFL